MPIDQVQQRSQLPADAGISFGEGMENNTINQLDTTKANAETWLHRKADALPANSPNSNAMFSTSTSTSNDSNTGTASGLSSLFVPSASTPDMNNTSLSPRNLMNNETPTSSQFDSPSTGTNAHLRTDIPAGPGDSRVLQSDEAYLNYLHSGPDPTINQSLSSQAHEHKGVFGKMGDWISDKMDSSKTTNTNQDASQNATQNATTTSSNTSGHHGFPGLHGLHGLHSHHERAPDQTQTNYNSAATGSEKFNDTH